MSDGIGKRLEEVRGKTSIKKFGEEYGAAANTVRAYEKGESSPPLDYLLRICNGHNVPPDWLILGHGSPSDTHQFLSEEDKPALPGSYVIYIDEHGLVEIPSLKNPNIEDFYFLPMVETRLSAGAGSFVISEAVETYYAFRKSFINRIATSHKNLVLACATGNSMEKTIYDGDTVMIDVGRRNIEDGKIFAVRFGETITIKRLSLLPNNKVMVISDNKEEYEPYEAQAKDIHVIGKLLISSHLHA